MTRKLVDVAQDVIILETDCGTSNGIWVDAVYEGEEEVVHLAARLFGRHASEDILNPAIFHTTNLLLHVLSTIIVFLIIRKFLMEIKQYLKISHLRRFS